MKIDQQLDRIQSVLNAELGSSTHKGRLYVAIDKLEQETEQRIRQLEHNVHGNGEAGIKTKLALVQKDIHDIRRTIERKDNRQWAIILLILAQLLTSLLS